MVSSMGHNVEEDPDTVIYGGVGGYGSGEGLGWAMTYWSLERYNSAFHKFKYLFQLELIIAIK